MNPFKKTGVSKIVIGDPWSPDSGNWIHVCVYYVDVVRKAGDIQTTTGATHRFKVQSFEEILPAVLEFSKRFQEATK